MHGVYFRNWCLAIRTQLWFSFLATKCFSSLFFSNSNLNVLCYLKKNTLKSSECMSSVRISSSVQLLYTKCILYKNLLTFPLSLFSFLTGLVLAPATRSAGACGQYSFGNAFLQNAYIATGFCCRWHTILPYLSSVIYFM